MLDRFAPVGLTIAAVIFAAVGTTGLVAPELLASSAEIELPSPSAMAEFRAAYFGSFAACAVLFAQGARRPESRQIALLLLGLVTAGFVAGRLVSLAIDGLPGSLAMGNLALEFIGSVLAWSVWWHQRRAARTQ